jgi:PLP dependent protein
LIADAVARVRDRVDRAAERADRDPASIRVVVASKYADLRQVLEVVDAGMTNIGVSRVQDLRDKYRVVGARAVWHFLGAVQTNKVRYLDVVELIHSLDRAREAEALQRRGEAAGRSWNVLIEVNVAGEASKQGISSDQVSSLLARLREWPLVHPVGFMTMAPRTKDPEDVRWVFAETRRLRDRFQEIVGSLEELSMGMTDDFEVAIEEGATIVRIGRAIFQGV